MSGFDFLKKRHPKKKILSNEGQYLQEIKRRKTFKEAFELFDPDPKEI